MYASDDLINMQNTFSPNDEIKFDVDPVKDEGPVNWLYNQAEGYPMQSQVIPTATPINDTPAPAVVVENVEQGTAAVFAPEPEKKTNVLLLAGIGLGLYFLLK